MRVKGGAPRSGLALLEVPFHREGVSLLRLSPTHPSFPSMTSSEPSKGRPCCPLATFQCLSLLGYQVPWKTLSACPWGRGHLARHSTLEEALLGSF